VADRLGLVGQGKAGLGAARHGKVNNTQQKETHMIINPITRSTQISGIGYDPDDRKLRIKFKKKGTEYDYFDVPQEVYIALLKADSVGKHFHQNIRNVYVCRKIPQDE
jgi:hypothetical protein